jgi:hypothetical protein
MADDGLESLGERLGGCGLDMQIHLGFDGWIVWLYPSDDPALLCVGEAATLPVAIRLAFDKWDHAKPVNHS